MDLYQIYSVMAYKYIGVTDERNALAVDCQGELDHHLPHLNRLKAMQNSF
jgi:hypothetical protein